MTKNTLNFHKNIFRLLQNFFCKKILFMKKHPYLCNIVNTIVKTLKQQNKKQKKTSNTQSATDSQSDSPPNYYF
jgi:hypothetical protein